MLTRFFALLVVSAMAIGSLSGCAVWRDRESYPDLSEVPDRAPDLTPIEERRAEAEALAKEAATAD